MRYACAKSQPRRRNRFRAAASSTPSATTFNHAVRQLEEGSGAQSGHAWTAAYIFNADAHWRFALEWIQVVSSNYNREELGGAPILTETQLQLAVRYALGSGVY
jgi:hypothetical protein